MKSSSRSKSSVTALSNNSVKEILKKRSCSEFTLSPKYELFVNCVTIINLISIMVRQIDFSESTQDIITWMRIQIGVNIFFFFESLSDLLMHGISNSYLNHFRIWPETMC